MQVDRKGDLTPDSRLASCGHRKAPAIACPRRPRRDPTSALRGPHALRAARPGSDALVQRGAWARSTRGQTSRRGPRPPTRRAERKRGRPRLRATRGRGRPPQTETRDATGSGPSRETRRGQNETGLAVGRKNWLFVGSDEAGEVNAAFTSLLASCRLCGIEPWSYLRDVFCLLPKWPEHRLLDLAPVHWNETSARDDVRALLDENRFRRVTLDVPR